MKQTRLSNGLTVVAVCLPHLHTTAIVVRVRAGSRYETPKTNGISHFVEHMLYRGNLAIGDTTSVHRKAARLGGTLEASTSSELVTFAITVPPDRLDDALAFLGTFFATPCFDDINVERAIVLDEMKHHLDSDGQPLSQFSLARQLLFEEHALGLPPIGRRENVREFQIDTVWEHFLTHYTGTNIVVGVAGPCDVDAVFTSAKRHFDYLAPGCPIQSQRYILPSQRCVPPRDSSIPRPNSPKTCHLPSHHQDVDLFVTFMTAPRTIREHLSRYTLQRALGHGLESLLYTELSQKHGLVYATDVSLALFSDVHMLDLIFTVESSRIAEVLGRTFMILATIRRAGVDEELLDIVKGRYRLDLLSLYDDCQALVSWATINALFGDPLPDPEVYAAIVDDFTPDTLRDATRHLLVAKDTMICAVGSLEDSVARQLGWPVVGRAADELQPPVIQDAPAR